MTQDDKYRLLAENPGLYETLAYYVYILFYDPRFESVVSFKYLEALDQDFQEE